MPRHTVAAVASLALAVLGANAPAPPRPAGGRPATSPDPRGLAVPAGELTKARELVRKLGSEVYREREEAAAALAKMGRLARPALLEAAATDADPEVRFRTARLLPKAEADELAARLDTYLADTDGRYDHELPGLKQFLAAVGRDGKARALFVEVVESPDNLELLRAVDRGPTQGGRAIADRRNRLYDRMQERTINGRVAPPQEPSLGELACLLLAEAAVPAAEIPRRGTGNQLSGAMLFQQSGASVNALSSGAAPHAEAYKRVVARWLASRDDPQDLNQLAQVVCSDLGPLRNFPQRQALMRRIVATDGVDGDAKAQALTSLVRQQGKDEVPFLTGLLSSNVLVTTVGFRNVGQGGEAKLVQRECLLRDVALAMLLTQTGQKLKDYCFAFPPGQGEQGQYTGYGYYAFTTDEARAAGMVKFGFWRLKQTLKGPAAAKPAPGPPPARGK